MGQMVSTLIFITSYKYPILFTSFHILHTPHSFPLQTHPSVLSGWSRSATQRHGIPSTRIRRRQDPHFRLEAVFARFARTSAYLRTLSGFRRRGQTRLETSAGSWNGLLAVDHMKSL